MPKELIIKEPRPWYSYPDEKPFFDRLESLQCVKSVNRAADGLHIALNRSPSEMQLREIIALLYRYGVDMRPLAALKTSRNAIWFADKKKFWHSAVFGRKERKSPSLMGRVKSKAL